MSDIVFTQSPVKPSLIARMGRRMAGLPPVDSRGSYQYQPQTVNITMDPIVWSGWFGPGQPLAPLADERVAGRIFDFPVTSNIDYQPKTGEGVPYQTLYNLARYYDGLRVVIEACKDDIAKQEFNIVPRDPKVKPDERCARIQTFLEYPDQEHSWDQWVRMLLDQMLVFDAMTVYPRLNNRGELRRKDTGAGFVAQDGELYALEVMDGSTIKRLIDYWGRTPLSPQPAYQQILKGVPAVDYTRDELIFFPTNVTPERVYGYSIVEQIITTINISLRREAYFLQYYTEGSTPDLIVSVPKDWTSKQIAEWQTYWNGLLQGNTSQRRGTTFVPDGFTINDTKERVLTDKSDEWLIRIICFAFGVSAQPFITMMNRATADVAKEQSEERGSGNRMQRIRAMMRLILSRQFNAPDLDFRWKEQDETDPKTKTDIWRNRVITGAALIDEWRADDGLDPLPDGLGAEPLIISAAGATLLKDVLNPPEPTVQPGAVGTDGTPPADGESASGSSNAPKSSKDGTSPRALKRAPVPHASGAPHPARVQSLAKNVGAALGMVRESAVASARQSHAKKAAGDDGDELSEADMSAILDGIDFSALGMLGDEFEHALGQSATGSAERAMVNVGVADPDLFTLGSTNAQAWAKTRAGELISDNGAEGEIGDATRNFIRDAITQALADGDTRDELAATLSSDYAFGEERADLIAATELRNAESSGYLEGAKASGVDLVKQWILDDEACDDCVANADAGFIDLDDTFPSGDDAPLAHPNCKCALGIVPRTNANDDSED